MADINKVWLSGLVISQPVLTKLSGKTPFTHFLLQVNEQFKDKRNIPQIKPNIIRIESLGKSAESAVKRVQQGARYTVDGYIRQDNVDGHDYIRVRAFAIYKDETLEQVTYKEGLKRALDILKKSPDKLSAIARFEELLSEEPVESY
jgi:single-stranded DNA-binding protein